jgi:multidrug efflux pump subunit AcrA (membrane-fusion protein)
MYATVTLKFDERPQTLAVPIEAVPAGAKSVLVVNSAQRLEERPVTLGLETSARYEVLRGLNEGELVMIGNRAQLAPGQKVEPRITAPLARE